MMILLGVIATLILIPIIFAYLPDKVEQKKRQDRTAKDYILAHAMLFLGDLGGMYILRHGYHEINGIMIGIQTQVDTICVGSRIGFSIVGLLIILLHIFMIINAFTPVLEEKYSEQVNRYGVAALIVFFVIGFGGSAFMKNQVENAGYTYCRNASGISALARTLVYTKTMAICEEETQKKTLKSASANDLRQ